MRQSHQAPNLSGPGPSIQTIVMDNLLGAVVSNSTNFLLLAGLIALLGLLILWRRREGKRPAAEETQPERKVRPAAEAAEQTGPASPPAPNTALANPVEQSAPSEPALDELDSGLFSEGLGEVSETDPLAEADIFLLYGYPEKAAELLCWHAEREGSADARVHRMLTEIYLRLGRIDDYAESLERLIDLTGATPPLRQALLDGLKSDPENLSLRVLADERFGLGLEEANALIGYRAAQESARPATLTVPEPMAAPSHQTAASALRTLLVQGDAAIAPPAAEEAEVLRAFAETAREAKPQRAHDTATGAIQALRRAIAKNPKCLVHYTDLLKIHLARRDVDEYARTLWQHCLVLGSAGQALKKRLLGAGLTLGNHPILEALAQAKTRAELEAIGRDNGLQAPTPAQQKLPLVVAVAGEEVVAMGLSETDHDVLREVDSYLEYGQIERALKRLEEAILEDQTAVQLYPTLLDLYDRMDDLSRFSAFDAELKKKSLRQPEEVVAMMSDLHQRLKSRTEKIAA